MIHYTTSSANKPVLYVGEKELGSILLASRVFEFYLATKKGRRGCRIQISSNLMPEL
jgi:hypothetical protein